MKSIGATLIGVLISILISSGNLFAQNDNGNETINDQQKNILINKAIALLKENYIYPERITKIETVIKK